MAINHGLGGPKAMAKAAAEGQPVNIPARQISRDGVTKETSPNALMVWRFQYQEFPPRKIRADAFNGKIRLLEKDAVFTASIWMKSFPRKTSKFSYLTPYRKPTLVDRARSPRGTSDSSLRNSAKKRP